MSLHVGIDFGTSNSGVSVYDGGRVRMLPIDEKNVDPQVVKTILYITRDEQAYIGQEAVELYYRHNVGRARNYVRRWVGEIEVYGGDMFYIRDVYTFVDELAPGRLLQYLKTALRTEGYEGTRVFERFYTPAELVAIYLRELKRRAEAILGESIERVTLGRPVHFHADPQLDRRAEDALRQAAGEAGFRSVGFELEPMAAALYYEQSLARPQDALIFDFGGGTLDITILRLGDPRRREVYASGGIDIAGSDFDRAIIRNRMLPHFGLGKLDGYPEILSLIHAVSDWMALPELSLPSTRHHLREVIQSGVLPVQLKSLESLIFNDLAFSFYRAVEEAKIRLSEHGATVIGLKDAGIDLWELYTRYQFEKDIREEAARIEEVLLETLAAAGREPAQIDAVVTTGGSSGIPLFRNMLARIFGEDRLVASDAFSSVASGLGIHAAQ